jgi:hypothetical protein
VEPRRYLVVSSIDNKIPEKISSLIKDTYVEKQDGGNYNWNIISKFKEGWAHKETSLPHYSAWCRGKKAHEKVIDLDVLRLWDRLSLIEFVAGLIDTDGSLYSTKSNPLILNFTTQSPSIKEGIDWLIKSLWQYEVTWACDKRDKYVNGPCWSFKITDTNAIKRIYLELNDHIVSPQKKWKSEYNNIKPYIPSFNINHSRSRETDVWDIEVESDSHLFLLSNGMVTHNSQTCARIITWILTETFPNWARPKEWGQEELLIIVAGRTGKQLEESLLPKLESFLEPNTYKVVRIGNIAQRLEHINGNRIVFQSLENPTMAQQRLQSYVAHVAWVDELPPTLGILRELMIRVQARNGYLLASFTPTAVATDIQSYIDSLQEPEGKTYRFSMLDNPLYQAEERRNQLLARYSSLSDSVQRAIFEGEWMTGENQVYYFNQETMVRYPENYSPTQWRHVEAVDPALKSALGLVVLAEDPSTGLWYVVHAEKISGIYVPVDIINAVQKRTMKYNVVRRISDPHEVWYIQQAASMGLSYIGVYAKQTRKGELIKQLQASLGSKVYLTTGLDDLVNEFNDCRWKDGGDQIVNGSKYHLLDALQYAVDNLPRYEGMVYNKSWEQQLYEANHQRLLMEEKQRERQANRNSRVQRRSTRWR